MKLSELTHPPSTSGVASQLEDVTLQDGDILQALSSTTARRILSALQESPAAPSTLAATVDISIQSVVYHLDKLEQVGLITPVATTYSEKGKEMVIYALTTDSLVVRLSEDRTSRNASG